MIDFEKMIIKGRSGKIYKIVPEQISTGRWAEYEIQALELSFGSDFKTFYTKLIEIHEKLTNGNNILQALTSSVEIIKQLILSIGNYAESPVPRIIKFCSLFCISDDEDVTTHPADLVMRKHEDWKHIPIADFFLLASEAIPSFRGIYRDILKEKSEVQSSNH